jgi:hypothetical protein
MDEVAETAKIFWSLFRSPARITALPSTPTSTPSDLGTPPGPKPK